MRHCAAIVWLVPAVLGAQASGAADSGARPISLTEAIALAQRNAPAAVQARGQIRTSAAAVRSAYGTFLPSLNLTVGNTRQAGERFDALRDQVVGATTTWQYNDGLNASMTLFNGGKQFFDLGGARANASAAGANEVSQRFTIALAVKQQYFNILAARESGTAAQSALEQADQQLRSAAAKTRAGAATRSDSLRSAIQVGNARLALLTARNDLRTANASLTRLVGAPFQVTATADTIVEPDVAGDTTTLLALADQGPAVRQADAGLSAARASLRSAKAPYLPTLSMSFNYGRTATAESFRIGGDPLVKSNSLRFGLSYPLFNQFVREEQLTRASATEDVADASLRDARLAARQTAIQLLGAMQSARERIAIQTSTVAAADEDLRVQQQRYALGASTLLDVLTSQTTLVQARAALIQARYDYRIAKAQMEALIGRDL